MCDENSTDLRSFYARRGKHHVQMAWSEKGVYLLHLIRSDQCTKQQMTAIRPVELVSIRGNLGQSIHVLSTVQGSIVAEYLEEGSPHKIFNNECQIFKFIALLSCEVQLYTVT